MRTRLIAEMGLCVALFALLQYFSIRLPINALGGTASLAMVPIIILALLRGPVVGVMCGVMCGMLDMLIEPFFFHPMQVLIDYPLAFGLVGLSGLYAQMIQRSLRERARTRLLLSIAAATVTAVLFRFIAHTLSGVVFFQSTFPDASQPWLYSALYNATYLIPSLVASLLVILVVAPVLIRTRMTDSPISRKEF